MCSFYDMFSNSSFSSVHHIAFPQLNEPCRPAALPLCLKLGAIHLAATQAALLWLDVFRLLPRWGPPSLVVGG
jgi:hypothetical protein